MFRHAVLIGARGHLAHTARLCSIQRVNVIAIRSLNNDASAKPQFNTPNPTPSQGLNSTQTVAAAQNVKHSQPGSTAPDVNEAHTTSPNFGINSSPSTSDSPGANASQPSIDPKLVFGQSGSSDHSTPPPPPPSSPAPAPKKRRNWWWKLKAIVYTGTLGSLVAAGYYVYQANHPPDQLPFDPSKKTVVVLGSGWGATALLDKIDTEHYNIVVISPSNYFLFTPLLPSVTVGTLNGRSITQPTRHLVRYKKREVQVLDAEATKIDVENKTVTFEDKSDITGNLGTAQIPYDYLVVSIGSENQTFGIEGVKKYALFLKELSDAEAIRRRLMDCVERASLLGQSDEEIDRLLHFVVVGGGPTGVEVSGEIRDFVRDDLSKWFPAVSGRVKVTLIEALPAILPSFAKNLVEYTEHVFKESEIEVLTKHIVKDAGRDSITVQDPNGKIFDIPTGMLIWAAGNTSRPLVRDVKDQLKDVQTERRGLLVDDFLRLRGAEQSVFALGDAAVTGAPPTAQTANQQGRYLATVLEDLARADVLEAKINELQKERPSADRDAEIRRMERKLERSHQAIKPFRFTNRGSMAYIGTEKAIVDLPYGGAHLSAGGFLTGLAWSSAYWSMLFGIRCRASVALDWLHVRVFGRSIESIRPTNSAS